MDLEYNKQPRYSFFVGEIKVFRWQNISLSGIAYIMFFGGLLSRRKRVVLC
jgi:hypothetical protein